MCLVRPPFRDSWVAVAGTLALAAWSPTPVAASQQVPASDGPAMTEPVERPPAGTVRINLDQFERLLQEGNVVLVDVRSDRAYLHAHLPDALSIPLDKLEAELDRLRQINARIVFYCDGQAGLKSGRAAALLQQRGFAHVYCLDGGFERWVASGRVVVVQPSDG